MVIFGLGLMVTTHFSGSAPAKIIVYSDYVIKFIIKFKTNNNTGYMCQDRYSV